VVQARQCTYKRNIEACSFNRYCCGKAISITYSECVSVALFIQHAPYCHLWPVRLYKIFPHYIIKGTIFLEKVY